MSDRNTTDWSPIPYYPAFIDLRGRRCVVIGGGEIAEGKVNALTGSDASVTVISPDLTHTLKLQADLDGITWKQRPYRKGDLHGAFLVVASTDHRATNEMVREEAEELGILCNVVDVPDLCNFIVPSSLQKGALTIAISTAGVAPRLAGRIRTELMQGFGEEYAKLLEILAGMRPRIVSGIVDMELRRRTFDEIFDSPALGLIRRGAIEAAREMLEYIVETAIGIQEGRIESPPDHTPGG